MKLYTETDMLAFREFDGTLEQYSESIDKKSVEDEIIDIVCFATNTPREILSLRTRRRGIVYNRQLCCWALYYFTHLSSIEISKFIGILDRSTVIFSIKK